MIACIVAISTISWASPLGNRAPELEELRDSWLKNWTAIVDMEVKYASIAVPDSGELADDVIAQSEHSLRWSEGRFLARMSAADIHTTQNSYDFVVMEGRTFDENSRSGSFGRARLDPASADWLLHQLKCPGPTDVTGFHWTSDLGGILSDEGASLRPGVELVEGRPAAIVDLSVKGVHVLSAWLDVERSAVPVKWEKHGDQGVLATVHLRDYVLLEGVAWQPQEIEVSFNAEQPHAGIRRYQRVLTDQSGAPTIRVNSGLGPEELAVEFPRGGLAYDEDTGETMLIAKKGVDLQETSRHLVEAVAERSEARSSERIVPRRSFWNWAAPIVVALLSVFGGISLRLRRR